jgi:hypothetical protein
MALKSYPNVTINTTTALVLDGRNNNVVLTSTLSSSVIIQISPICPAGTQVYVVQYGTGAVGVTALSGATANNVTGATGTSGQYARMHIILVTDGNAIFSGDVS